MSRRSRAAHRRARALARQERAPATLVEARIRLAVPSAETLAGSRIKLCVPYEEKDMAKALGARWDGIERCWWTLRLDGLLCWLPDGGELIALPKLKRKGVATPKSGFRLYDAADRSNASDSGA